MKRWLRWFLMAALTADAAWISYKHGLFVAREVGNTGDVAYGLPLLPDGLIGVSTLALVEASAASVTRPRWATIGLVLGIGLTTAMNVAAGIPGGWGSALMAGFVPLVLIVALEVLVYSARLSRDNRALKTFTDHAEEDEPPDLNRDLLTLVERHSQRIVAELFGVSRNKVERRVRSAREALAPPAVEVSLNGDGPREP